MVSTVKVTNIDTPDNTGNVTFDRPIVGDGSGLTSLSAANLTGAMASGVTGAGKVLQVVKTIDVAYRSGTTATPYDDTIPTSSEGTAFSGLDTTITASNASNILRITVNGEFGGNTTFWNTVALFKDSEYSASHVLYHYITGQTRANPIHLVYHQVAGSTSAQTWKIRSGMHTSGTITLNGDGGSRKYGGTLHAFMQIEEIAV